MRRLFSVMLVTALMGASTAAPVGAQPAPPEIEAHITGRCLKGSKGFREEPIFTRANVEIRFVVEEQAVRSRFPHVVSKIDRPVGIPGAPTRPSTRPLLEPRRNLEPKLTEADSVRLRAAGTLGGIPLRIHVLRAEGTAAGVRVTTRPIVPVVTKDDAGGKLLIGSFVDRTAALGKNYSYRIELVDPSGAILARAKAVSIPAHDGEEPAAVRNLRATATDEEIRIEWGRSTDAEVTSYRVYRQTIESAAPPPSREPRPKPIFSSREGTASAGALLRAPASTTGAGVGRPGEPTRKAGRVDLSRFLGAAPPLSLDGRRPLVPRDVALLAFGTKLADVPASAGPPSFVDRTAVLRAVYAYRVIAVDANGPGEIAPPVRSSLLDVVPPAAPSALRAAPQAGGVVQLEWRSSPSGDVKTYRVFRSTDPEIDPTPALLVERKTGTTQAATDHVDPVIPYRLHYSVVAVDGSGNVSPPAAASPVELPDIVAPASPVITDVEIRDHVVGLAWSAPLDEDVASYRVFRQNAAGQSAPVRLDGAILRARSFEDSTGTVGAVYRYWVTALDERNNESAPSPVLEQKFLAKINPVPPAGVAAANDPRGARITWSMPGGITGMSYLVLRADAPTGPFMPVSPAVPEGRFVDVGARGSKWYRVVARYPDGQLSSPTARVAWSGGGQ